MSSTNLLPWFVQDPNPEIYRTGVPLFLDFETHNHKKGLALYPENFLVLACWQTGYGGKMNVKWGGEYDMRELLEDIEKASFIVAHNAKFELQWLARCGMDLHNVLVYDTLLGEYVIGGNRWQYAQLSLEQTAQRHGLGGKDTLVSKMIKAGVSPADIPQEWLLKYCRRDVELLPLILQKQLNAMKDTKLLPVVYSRCLLTPVLAEMEFQGLKLDPDVVRTTREAVEAKHTELTIKLNEMTGGINLGSRQQLAVYLYDVLGFEELKIKRKGKWEPLRTPTGGRSTSADTITDLVPITAKQKEFLELYLEHADLDAQLSKYLRKFQECCDKDGGLLYAQFNQSSTQTHRLSSTGLDYKTQFQNLPRHYKSLFVASRNGWYMGEGDGATLEFRVAAHAGRCTAAVADILAKVDVHAFTSRTLTEAGQNTDRQDAKPHTFKPLYGGSSGTAAERTYYEAFKAKYPGITSTQDRWKNTVLIEKKLETEWGLVFYWPDTKLTQSGYITNTPSICNYPVQSLATAEVIPLALVCMWHRLKRMRHGSYIVLVNTIHDSIVAEIHPDFQQVWEQLCIRSFILDARDMMIKLYGIDLTCPLGCGVKSGERWGAGKEVKFEQEELNADQRHDWTDEREGLLREERDGSPILVPATG